MFENATNSKVKEIEEKLEVIEEIFESEIHNLKLFKKGPLLFNNNNLIYNGSWNSQFLKEGFGISIDQEGNKYTGYWKNDTFEGHGRIISIQGDYYEGNWNKGNIEGQGIFYSSMKKIKYEGEFKNNKFNGEGKLFYQNEKIMYEGSFIDGKKEGKGIMLFHNCEKYEGDFKNDCFWGEGIFKWRDGRKYNGSWKNNSMDGQGEFFYDSETKYKGDFKENKKDGKGIYYYKNMYYTGDWVNNMPHGEGKIFVDNKMVINGIFRYGKLMNKEGNQNIKNSKSSEILMEKIEEKGTGVGLSSKETGAERVGKIKENDKKNVINVNKNIATLKNKNKVANPMEYKFGFLEKAKKNKK